MKRKLYLLIFLFSLLFIACQDDVFVEDDFEGTQNIETRNSKQTNPIGNSTTKLTILGNARINPFSVSNVNSAKVALYGINTTSVSATHKYVKFSPTTQDHLAELDLWETTNQIPVFDFPLEYEVLVAGEYYIDPGVTDSLYTYRYASVPVNTSFPLTVPTQVLEDLYIDYSNPLVLAQSFQMTGNGSEINKHFNDGDGINPNDLDNNVISSIPTPPDCGIGFYPVLTIDNSTSPVTFSWICVPNPPSDNGDGLNECNCPIPENERNPGGCVTVDFDGTDMPVTSITVKVKDNWYTSDFATTDENGCWRVDDEFSGRMKMWIVYKNSACKIRDIGYWLGFRVLKDYIGQITYPFNETYVPYSDGSSNIITDEERMFWAGANSINTVVQYLLNVDSDGILRPRSHLNILNCAGSGAASAPMLQGNPFNSSAALLIMFVPFANFANLVTTNLQPDITNRYANNELAATFTGTLFHELGHASHHQAVGEGYWFWYRNHIILNLGYGSFSSFATGSSPGSSPGRVALGEAFGSFIGNRYGGTISGGEFISFDSPSTPVDERQNYIPRGLMFDLIDTGNDLIIDPNDNSSSIDNISGFSASMIFSAMNQSNITSIRDFRDRLRTLHLSSTSNSASNFNTFLDQYDVFN